MVIFGKHVEGVGARRVFPLRLRTGQKEIVESDCDDMYKSNAGVNASVKGPVMGRENAGT